MSAAPQPNPPQPQGLPRTPRLANPRFRPEGVSIHCSRPRVASQYKTPATSRELLFINLLRGPFFRRKLGDAREAHPDILAQVGYSRMAAAAGCSYKTAYRTMHSMARKHFIQAFKLTAGGNPETGRKPGEDPREATQWVIFGAFSKTLRARADDARIAKDRNGRPYIIGRGRRFIGDTEMELWQINRRLDSDPEREAVEAVPLPVPEGVGSGDRARKPRAAAADEQAVPDAPLPTPIAPPQPPDAPASAQAAERYPKAPKAIRELLARYNVHAGRETIWPFVERMTALAAENGYELSPEELAEAMGVPAEKAATAPNGRVGTFAFFETAVPKMLPGWLDQHHEETAEAAAACLREETGEEHWRRLIDEATRHIEDYERDLASLSARDPDHERLKQALQKWREALARYQQRLDELLS